MSKQSKDDIIIAGNKLYAICDDCGRLVRVNKPFLGTIHFSLSDEERKIKRENALNNQQQPKGGK